MTLATRLADYVISTKFTSLDARTIKEIKARIIDALGCAIGAFHEMPVGIARHAVGGLRGAGSSTFLGTETKSSPELATFVNGLMVRYFDFNDTYLSKEPAHPSDNLAPCLAVAEAEEKNGKELIAAVVAAYEVQCRLCDAADLRHRGWDHVNYGLASTPLASAKLMDLDKSKATHALNIAINGHIAMRQVRAGVLSMWKGASFANAARNGVFAAMLAREGMTGPAPIFEGEMGFFRQVSGRFSLDIGQFGGRRGRYRVNDTFVKYWPAEYHAQTAVWAALELGKMVKPGSIKSIVVDTHEAGYTILAKDREKWYPATKETADHSLPFIVGMALLEGTIDNTSYSDARLHDRRILDFLGKIRVREDPLLTAMYPSKGMANRVTIKDERGRSFSKLVKFPRGHPQNPLTRTEIENKFIKLTKSKLGERRARLALRELWRLEKADDISALLGLLKATRNASNP